MEFWGRNFYIIREGKNAGGGEGEENVAIAKKEQRPNCKFTPNSLGGKASPNHHRLWAKNNE
jgi:hypothetical protein